MTKSTKLSALSAAIVLAGVALFLSQWNETAAPPVNQQPTAIAAHKNAAPNSQVATEAEIAQSAPLDQPATATPPLASAENAGEQSEEPAKMFQADAHGDLVLKEQTRLNIEKLSSLYTQDELRQRMNVIEQTLPAGAYRELVDLLDRYQNFMTASKQAIPTGIAPATVEDAVAQLDQLHDLRVAHFGAEAAEAMYGGEEKLGRQLLAFMSLEKHEGLTMDEKAMKAQEMLSNSPALAAAYEANRRAAPTKE